MSGQVAAWFKRTAWVRWACLVPGSLLTGLAVHFPIHWIVMFGTTFFRSGPDHDNGGLSLWNLPAERLEQYLAALIVPGTIVYMTGKIAPSHRVTTAIIATVVGGGLYAVGAGYLITNYNGGYVDMILDLLLPLVLNAASVKYALPSARELPEPA